MKTQDYLKQYAPELSAKIHDTFKPLQTRGDRTYVIPGLLREPMGAQYDAIVAISKAMQEGEKTVNLIGDMGTGKTYVAMAALHDLSKGRPYRVVVMSPPHLVDKWCREAISTIPGAKARIIERYTELVPIARDRIKSRGAEYFIVSQNMAKLGTAWAPSIVKDKRGRLHCPRCHAIPKRVGDDGLEMELLTEDELAKSQYRCEQCGDPLWSWVAQYDRWPVATYIAKKMRGLFDYAIIDEAHEEAAEASACAIAMSKLVQSVRHVIPATGTLINGYAHSVMSLMWRTSPASLAAMGFEFGQATEFSRKYGRLEKMVKSKAKPESNKESRGSTARTTVKVLPGVMPSLVGDHLLGKCVFVSLEDVSASLPPFLPEVVGVSMDEQQMAAYRSLENHMAEAIQLAMQEKNPQLLTKLVQALIGYTDYPSGYGDIGYQNQFGEYVHVCTPPDLGWGAIRPKEQALIDSVLEEAAAGRKSWIYVEQTKKRDIQPRIAALLKAKGLRVKVLKSNTVSTREREKWIAEHGPKADVLISHAAIVSTGLDFFDRAKTYNFPTIIFYQCGLKISTLRQASRRAWRIGQDQPCKVKYLFYNGTMQERFIHLMSAKLQAAEAIDGKFSLDGLAALSESGESMGIALAKELLQTIRGRELSTVA